MRSSPLHTSTVVWHREIQPLSSVRSVGRRGALSLVNICQDTALSLVGTPILQFHKDRHKLKKAQYLDSSKPMSVHLFSIESEQHPRLTSPDHYYVAAVSLLPKLPDKRWRHSWLLFSLPASLCQLRCDLPQHVLG